MKILYVHGYNGNPYGESYNNLKNACGDLHELYTIDYDANNPKEAILNIFKYVKNNNIECVIGASLGGFLTMHLSGVLRIVVNPCWDPATELPIVGYNDNIECYKTLLNDLLEYTDIEESELCAGVFANNDELLGNKYLPVFKKYFKRAYNINGGHRISVEMANEIINNILPNHDNAATEFCEKLKMIDNAPWIDNYE